MHPDGMPSAGTARAMSSAAVAGSSAARRRTAGSPATSGARSTMASARQAA